MIDGLRKSHLRKAPQVGLSEVGLPEGNPSSCHCKQANQAPIIIVLLIIIVIIIIIIIIINHHHHHHYLSLVSANRQTRHPLTALALNSFPEYFFNTSSRSLLNKFFTKLSYNQ